MIRQNYPSAAVGEHKRPPVAGGTCENPTAAEGIAAESKQTAEREAESPLSQLGYHEDDPGTNQRLRPPRTETAMNARAGGTAPALTPPRSDRTKNGGRPQKPEKYTKKNITTKHSTTPHPKTKKKNTPRPNDPGNKPNTRHTHKKTPDSNTPSTHTHSADYKTSPYNDHNPLLPSTTEATNHSTEDRQKHNTYHHTHHTTHIPHITTTTHYTPTQSTTTPTSAPQTICTSHTMPKMPKFTDSELRVMVDEIIRVEPHLFGALVQQTTIATKTQMWERIVTKVNAVGDVPRSKKDILKRWHDVKKRVKEIRHKNHELANRTGGGAPIPPKTYTDWEEKVLTILHPEGLAGIEGGVEAGDRQLAGAQDTGSLQHHSPSSEHGLSGAESLANSDADEEPGPSGMSGLTRSQDNTVPTTTSAATPVTTPAVQTCSATTTTTTTTCAATITLPAAQDNTTTPTLEEGRESMRVSAGGMPQVRASRAGGRGAVQQTPTAPGSEALANIARVLGAYERSQEQTDQTQNELREIRLLLRSLDDRMGQFLDLMGQLVAVQRDRLAAQTTPPPPSRGQQEHISTSSSEASEREGSPDRAAPTAEAPPPKKPRGRPRKDQGGPSGNAPATRRTRSQP